MHPRYPSELPRLWLMTDERMGDALCPAIARLPRGSGVIFRHYSLTDAERRALLAKVERVARRRRLLLVVAGRMSHHAHPVHGRVRGALTAPVHSAPEIIAAQRHGARLLFISPVFATQSHPDARALGRVRLGLMMMHAKRPVIALGGMNPRRARSLRSLGVYGWAGIDAFRT